MSSEVKNQYSDKTGFRTFCGVVAAILSMGIPVGVVAIFQGSTDIAIYSGIAVLLAAILAFSSVRGWYD